MAKILEDGDDPNVIRVRTTFGEPAIPKIKKLAKRYDSALRCWLVPAGLRGKIEQIIADNPVQIKGDGDSGLIDYPAEKKRRRAAKLGVRVHPAYRAVAKKIGGIYDDESRTWLMPDAESAERLIVVIGGIDKQPPAGGPCSGCGKVGTVGKKCGECGRGFHTTGSEDTDAVLYRPKE
jgi:hypothetical protein